MWFGFGVGGWGGDPILILLPRLPVQMQMGTTHLKCLPGSLAFRNAGSLLCLFRLVTPTLNPLLPRVGTAQHPAPLCLGGEYYPV